MKLARARARVSVKPAKAFGAAFAISALSALAIGTIVIVMRGASGIADSGQYRNARWYVRKLGEAKYQPWVWLIREHKYAVMEPNATTLVEAIEQIEMFIDYQWDGAKS